MILIKPCLMDNLRLIAGESEYMRVTSLEKVLSKQAHTVKTTLNQRCFTFNVGLV